MKLGTRDDLETLHEENPEGLKDYWWKLLLDEEDKHADFRHWAECGQNAYEKACTFNIAWPTVEITCASLYSSTPDPEVRRRQRDGDKAQRTAAQVVERGIDFCVDQHDFDGNMIQTITDLLNGGIGVGRIVYEPTISSTMDPFGMPAEEITSQLLRYEHYSWKHFGWQPCKNWELCEWVYFKHMMSRKKVERKWGVKASEDFKDEDSNTAVAVYEILHKPSRSTIVIAEQFNTPLEVSEDRLGLKDYFPLPQPMMLNVKTDKLIPFSDFKYYKRQFEGLDKSSKRIEGLVHATKAQAFYDAHFQELQKIKTSRDGMFFPVEDLIDKLENSTNLKAVIAEVPIDNNAAVIEMLINNKEYLKSEVYEILGISDIMRGESNPQEGVETQQLKSEFGAVRIREKQGEVNRYCRDVFRLMGEIISEHFEPAVLQKATGVEITPDVMEILRSDFLRDVSIDIETDSTNAGDKLRHRKEANESLQSLMTGLGSLFQGMSSGVLPQMLGYELMKLLVSSVDGNTGNIEDIVSMMGEQGSPENMVMQLQQQIGQMSQQMQAMQAELERRDQAQTAKDMTQANLNQARAQEIQAGIPGDIAQQQADIVQTQVETQGKRVEQAANIVSGVQGREPWIRGVE